MRTKKFLARLALVATAVIIFPSIVLAAKIDTSEATFSALTRFATPETEPARAFDGDTETYYMSNRAANDEWLEVAFPAPVTVKSIRLMHGLPTVTLNGRLEGSNDESDWDTLTNISEDPVDTFITENFENTTAYQYYRLYFTTGVEAGDWVKIYEWELYTETNAGVPIPEFTTTALFLVIGLSAFYFAQRIQKP